MRIGALLASKKPVFSFEFFPPKTQEAAEQLERTISDLKPLEPDFVSVTYGAGGSTREKTIDIVSRIRRDTGIESMAHLTCVGATGEELRDVLQRLRDAGVENVLALRGDPPKGQTTFTPTEGGFRYGSELVGFIRDGFGDHFSIGAAAYPEKHVECGNPAVDLANLRRKVDAGAQFLVTQLFFDNRKYFEFVDNARAAGIHVPIVPGIMPITNAGSIERVTLMCGASLPYRLAVELDRRRDDPQAVMQLGIAHATAQCIELLQCGAPGIHFYTLNRSTATMQVLSALRIIGFASKPTAAQHVA
ncbi:MAG TPA: methylenetetrahydrofolate reductase [NAD(P)H] [Bryobacteraceae bacterium]|nr:methylenetetrahydrofolate reductase [NAD(P)H] [Bryobacteraceae bacterium]